MGAKRLGRKRTKHRILKRADQVETEPQKVTCPGCGAEAELTDHVCPQCGQLFYERPRGRVGRESSGPPRHDRDAAEFGRRMEEMEKWTRVICTVAGVISGLLAVLLLVSVFKLPLIATRAAVLGAFLLLVLSVACFLRGLGPPDADVRGLGG
jgi:ribosomal protein L32